MNTKGNTQTKRPTINLTAFCALALAAGLSATLHADTFGTGPNQFTIDFVTIGNAGNADDAGAGGGIYSSPNGGVPYVYQIGVTEVPQDWITKATAGGLLNVTAGAWTGNQPAANMNWYEAAAFVNWLNTTTGHQAAYQLTAANTQLIPWSSGVAWQAGGENRFRHKDAYYFLPSDDEWYKAAYHQNDGVTANYWDYPTGSNAVPTAVASGTTAGTAVYNNQTFFPAGVDNNGGLSAYGTRGQGGNIWEWTETAYIAPNDSGSEDRMVRGGWYFQSASFMASASDGSLDPASATNYFGFRVASVPEPSSTGLLLSAAMLALARRQRRSVL